MRTAAPPASPLLSDEDLMRRVKADDADAFEELYDRYSSRAFGLAVEICNSNECAEEAVQDAFVSVWRTRARYDQGRGGIQSWIFALVRNRSVDIYRRNRRGDGLRASEAHLDRIAMIGSVEDDAVKRDEGERVRGTLRQMPALQREVIALVYFGGLSHSEIAQRLDVPLGTVTGRTRLGLEKVRAGLVLLG